MSRVKDLEAALKSIMEIAERAERNAPSGDNLQIFLKAREALLVPEGNDVVYNGVRFSPAAVLLMKDRLIDAVKEVRQLNSIPLKDALEATKEYRALVLNVQ